MSQKNTLNDVRSSFLEFFKDNSHEILDSAPLIPHNDPSLMFVNAGMVPFKNIFQGKESINNSEGSPIIRATTSQKCVRAGGKHNDLDNVGYTKRHHTFFEMLGNFSFGDYFKEKAILHAWEYLTKTIALPPEKLLVTIYHTDDKAFELWKKIAGLPDEKIIRISTNDNFWAMGDTGPCGPCSEIFYDHGDNVEGGPPGSKDEDGDRFVEIWNLVFMQHTRDKERNLNDLPKQSIDTGMGLERMTTVLQGVHDNFETDLFKNLIAASKEVTKNKGDGKDQFSHRIITDHLRSSAFLIADGVLPDNEGRGYVLRRIMRRAMRHCHQLSPKEVVMHKLLGSLIAEMGQAYPELKRAESLITQTLKNEEEKFRETLENGLKLLNSEVDNLNGGKDFSGATAFKLYDTYGFPFDLTQDILREKNIKVDETSFKTAMDEQKKRAKASWAGSGEVADDALWQSILEDNGQTNFTGYEEVKDNAKLVAIVANGKIIDEAKQGDKVAIVTDKTCFYAESGGQAGDKGSIKIAGDAEFVVNDTKKLAGKVFAHLGQVTEGKLRVGEEVLLDVDCNRREKIKKNHSATHILHAVLRKILGDHVTQKGSLVEEDYLRFDFSNPKAISKEQLLEIEMEVNRIIADNSKAQTQKMPAKQAIESGAMALFGEKYGDEVRVVSMGEEFESKKYSVELCGGTHVSRTGDIGLFKIVKESSVSSGVRRIEAATYKKALNLVSEKENLINEVQEILKTGEDNLIDKVREINSARKNLDKEVQNLRKKLALLGGGDSSSRSETEANIGEIEEFGNIKFISKILNGVAAKDLRGIVDDYKKQHPNAVILLVTESDGKVGIVSGVTDGLTEKISAVDVVRKTSEILGGKGGGGRPDFAQGGAASIQKAAKAVEEVRNLVSKL